MKEASSISGRVLDRRSTASDVIEGIDLSEKRAIITGGASGIGIETARAFAQAGAEVTLAVRNVAEGERVAASLNDDAGKALVRAQALDLSDLGSVRAFADGWRDDPLNFLVNNAGVMACPLSRTKDGFETQIGVNHLGHFLLSVLLVPALSRGAPSRLVALSSSAHVNSPMNFDDPHFRVREYQPFAAYAQSKTANALFALEFDRRYRDQGIRAFSVMPGVISETNLIRHMTPDLVQASGLQAPSTPSDDARGPIFYKNLQQGAATTIWAAVSRELDGQGGLYLHDCQVAQAFSPALPRGHGVHDHARDPVIARTLWSWSEREVGLPVSHED